VLCTCKKDIIHGSSIELFEYSKGSPSRHTLKFVMFAERVFEIVSEVYPVVPDGRVAVNLNSRLVEESFKNFKY